MVGGCIIGTISILFVWVSVLHVHIIGYKISLLEGGFLVTINYWVEGSKFRQKNELNKNINLPLNINRSFSLIFRSVFLFCNLF